MPEAISVHCADKFCEDCHGQNCTHPCHAGQGDEGIEADEWDPKFGWGECDD